ncbi:hypothetical protein V6N11_056970 [Hibiscus sabdariffa]|uniref:Uncharacterized protein n=1 Tax=Hibiscus sabdariffa TaxID=183260 RepID=A0ABR2T5D1_9ROSI
MKMKMDNGFYVDPIGLASGLALWWNNEIKLSVLQYDKNFVDTIISFNGEDEWFVTSPNEKYGGSQFDQNNAKWYFEFLERSYLMELHSKGGAYTWSNQRSEEEEICEKLDRVLSSLEWGFLFPKALVVVDIAVASDHAPIVLLINGIMKKFKKDFKFESRWTLENECSDIVKEEWTPKEGRHNRSFFRINLRRTRVKL